MLQTVAKPPPFEAGNLQWILCQKAPVLKLKIINVKRLVITLGLLLFSFGQNAYTQQNTDCQNLVPDEITAIKIAEAV